MCRIMQYTGKFQSYTIQVQWNLAKRRMKISDPIFPIEMELPKQ